MIGIVSDEDLLNELTSLGGVEQSQNVELPTGSSIGPSDTPVSDCDANISNPADAIELPVGQSTPDGHITGPGVVVDIARGRGNTRQVPESLRKLVATAALEGASPKSIEEHLGISPSSTSAYKVGATSTASYHQPNGELLDHVTTKRGKITERATRKLLLALRNISPEKVENAKLKELSGLAKDMSTVMRNMDQSANNPLLGGNKGPTYIFYAPRIKKEDAFEVVHPVEEF